MDPDAPLSTSLANPLVRQFPSAGAALTPSTLLQQNSIVGDGSPVNPDAVLSMSQDGGREWRPLWAVNNRKNFSASDGGSVAASDNPTPWGLPIGPAFCGGAGVLLPNRSTLCPWEVVSARSGTIQFNTRVWSAPPPGASLPATSLGKPQRCLVSRSVVWKRSEAQRLFGAQRHPA